MSSALMRVNHAGEIAAQALYSGQSVMARASKPRDHLLDEAADDRLVVGGTETWINNFELELPIIKQAGISTVTFFDAGNAFGDPWGVGHIDITDLRFSYGFGVRWFSPMGPLRFEWGFPIGRKPGERAQVFEFTIGSFF